METTKTIYKIPENIDKLTASLQAAAFQMVVFWQPNQMKHINATF